MSLNLIAAEGFVLGVGAKMFTIAGPVIVCGLRASVVYGFIYWATKLSDIKRHLTFNGGHVKMLPI